MGLTRVGFPKFFGFYRFLFFGSRRIRPHDSANGDFTAIGTAQCYLKQNLYGVFTAFNFRFRFKNDARRRRG